MIATNPHSSVQSAGNLIILLQSRAASEDLGEPELGHGTLHVADLALDRRRCLHPLRGLAAHAADHVGMGEGLGGPLLGLDIQRRRDGLGDARVKRRGPARDDEVAVGLVAGDGAAIAIAGPRSCERGVGVQ